MIEVGIALVASLRAGGEQSQRGGHVLTHRDVLVVGLFQSHRPLDDVLVVGLGTVHHLETLLAQHDILVVLGTRQDEAGIGTGDGVTCALSHGTVTVHTALGGLSRPLCPRGKGGL